MKLRALQISFVAASLLLAGLVVRHGRPHLLQATQAQQMPLMSGRPQGPDGQFSSMREARPLDRRAAVATIQAQLGAFRRGDYVSALRCQSRAMRRRWRSAAAFRQMMVTGYPAFLHFRSVTFGDAMTQDTGRHLIVLMRLHMADKTQIPAVYFMVREDGKYRVGGAGGGLQQGGPFLTPGAGDDGTAIST